MKKIIALLVTFNCLTCFCSAQFSIEPLVGYQIDLNNSNRYKQVNSGIQFCWNESRVYELLFQVKKSWPIASVSGDSSFTLNPNLPVYSNAEKTIRPAALSFAIGQRFKVAGKKSSNVLFILLYTGITSQEISVNYQYDKSNYTILNPDKTQTRIGPFISGGLEYMRLLKRGRCFFQVNLSTAPIRKKIKYPSSFTFVAPLSFNAGYSIKISKK